MKKSILIAILFLAGGLFVSNTVNALTISPVKLELLGNPGEIVQSQIILVNEGKETKTFYSSFENFEAQGESGTPNFTTTKDGLASWIMATDSITLTSGEKQIIPVNIQIPQDAEAGGYFAAVFWSTVPPQTQGGGQVAVGAKIGSLILLKVSGETKEGGGVLEFYANNKQKFLSSLPISFMYRFQNSGSDRVKPEGEIKIKNIFGGTLATLLANKNAGNILPDSIRKFEVGWTGAVSQDGAGEGFFAMVAKGWSNFALGRYTAELNLKYGVENQEANASYSFFVIPWQLLSVIFVILAILGFLGVIGLKKYNRWIIAKATGQQK